MRNIDPIGVVVMNTQSKRIQDADGIHMRLLNNEQISRTNGNKIRKPIAICKLDCEILPLGCEYRMGWYTKILQLVTIYPYVETKGRLIKWTRKRKRITR